VFGAYVVGGRPAGECRSEGDSGNVSQHGSAAVADAGFVAVRELGEQNQRELGEMLLHEQACAALRSDAAEKNDRSAPLFSAPVEL